MSPRIGGVVGVLVGVAALGFTYYLAKYEGKMHPLVAALGPLVIPFSLALALLGPGAVMKPKEVDGRVEYDTRNPTYTPLGWLLLAVGLAGGGALFYHLKYGF